MDDQEPGDDFRHSDDVAMGGVTHSIRPGVRCPATVLVVAMTTGGYLLVKYPEGEPAALVIAEDASYLRQGLEGAFGHPAGKPVNGDGSGLDAGSHNREP